VWFAISLVMLSGADYPVVRAWIGSPLVMVLLILTDRHRPASRPARHAGRVGGLHRRRAARRDDRSHQVLAALFGLGAIVAILRIGLGG
jgi:succinate dehydrogenase / fumarate reductase membrane anchor subunit